jgi:hypothetical protein
MAVRIGSANLKAREFRRTQAHKESQQNSARSNEAKLDIAPDALSDESISGIVVDWLVPMIVDHVVERILHPASTGAQLQARGYYEHNNLRGIGSDGEKSEGWTATEASPAQTDQEAPIVADECRIQGAERVRHAAKPDSK